VTNGFQKFYERWRNNSTNPELLNRRPYKLSLGVNPEDVPFYTRNASASQILVTEAYDDVYHRLLLRRKNDPGDERGAVLTGQPGIGASP
jgi:hypothetical protein